MQAMLQNSYPSSTSDFSTFERQRDLMQWQQSFLSMDDIVSFSSDNHVSPPNSVHTLHHEEYPFHDFANGLPNLPSSSVLGCSVFPTNQTQASPSASSLRSGREGSSKKRKAETPPTNEGEKGKKMKLETVAKANEEKKGEANPEGSAESLKENGAPPPPSKQDFIHVRARRGQATDSHSLAERVRRERISEKMKYLQGLVPGCDKVTGKAGMLDEIINYVQALQRQVEFLSMKLAAANPWNDNFFLKEINPTIPAVDVPPEMVKPSYLQPSPMHQMPPITVPNTAFFHPSINVNNFSWDANLQSISCADFSHGKESIFPLQSGCRTI